MKSLVGKFGTLALLAAVGGLAVQGCSSDIASSSPGQSAGEGKTGTVSLNLVPVSGITVNSVNYVVTGTPAIPGTPLPSQRSKACISGSHTAGPSSSHPARSLASWQCACITCCTDRPAEARNLPTIPIRWKPDLPRPR